MGRVDIVVKGRGEHHVVQAAKLGLEVLTSWSGIQSGIARSDGACISSRMLVQEDPSCASRHAPSEILLVPLLGAAVHAKPDAYISTFVSPRRHMSIAKPAPGPLRLC
jgi:hypothetical protein